MNKILFERILAKLHRAYYNSYSEEYKQKILLAKQLLEAGFVENLLNNSFIKNIINLLAPFIQNKKIKEAIRLLQEGLKDISEEKEKKEKIKKKNK